jgi:hypothetical protein
MQNRASPAVIFAFAAIYAGFLLLVPGGQVSSKEHQGGTRDAGLIQSGSAHLTTEPVAKDGTAVQCDLPAMLHMRNTGGSDGAGLCVFTSLEHSARWQNVRPIQGFQKWMTRRPGGGYPDKVDAMIKAFCQEQGVPVPKYLQVESTDLGILRKALASGRSVGVTYCKSPTGRYGGGTISHMVSLMAAGAGNGPDGKGWWAILDNNFPGTYEWMSEAEFLRTYAGISRGWAVIFLAPPPPPAPKN